MNIEPDEHEYINRLLRGDSQEPQPNRVAEAVLIAICCVCIGIVIGAAWLEWRL